MACKILRQVAGGVPHRWDIGLVGRRIEVEVEERRQKHSAAYSPWLAWLLVGRWREVPAASSVLASIL